MGSCIDTVTQGDYELSSAVSGCDDFDALKSSDDRMKLVAPGETMTLEVGYILQNETDDIKIRIDDIYEENQVLGEVITIG
jgi:hypothetical protein